MKRIATFLLAAVMLLSLAACGGKDDIPNEPADQTPPAAADNKQPDTAVPVDEMPVVRLCINKPGTGEGELVVEEAVNKLLAERYGIQVDIVLKQDNTQLNLMLTGGEDTVDIFTSFWFMSQSTLYNNGQLLNLDPYMEKEGKGILELYKDYPEVLNCGKIGGSLYGIPAYTAWSTPNIYTVKEDISNAANIDWSKVKTLADATEAMVAMKQATPSTYLVPGATQTYWVPKDLDDLGDTKYLGVIIDPDTSTTVENYYESAQFVDFLEQVKVWKANNIISPDPMSNDQATLYNLMYGIVDGTPGYSWSIDEFCYEANEQQNFNGNMVGAQIGERYITTGTVQTYMWHISSFTKVPEAAVTLLNALYTDDDVAFLVAFGLENEHYVLDENGQLRYPNDIGAFDDAWCGIPMDYWPNLTGCPTFYYQPVDKYEMMMATNDEAKISRALGFVFDSSSVADEMAACSSVVDQYYLPLINGEVDIDSTLAAFQQALKGAGIDTIVAEKQAQLNAWLAAQ